MELSRPIYRLRRQARLLSRAQGIALHAALDHVARQEGFASWSLLVARLNRTEDRSTLLSDLAPGDLVLLGGRPGHGKTLLGLEIALDARRRGSAAWFFTLEYTHEDVGRCLATIGADETWASAGLCIDTSDDICADHIDTRLAAAGRGTVAVVDYLQLLDQKRSHDDLQRQVPALARLARRRGLIVVCLSQIDRRFERSRRRMPSLEDVRCPNPVDVRAFTKACFIHEGRVALRAVA